jgi:hypothetical protein
LQVVLCSITLTPHPPRRMFLNILLLPEMELGFTLANVNGYIGKLNNRVILLIKLNCLQTCRELTMFRPSVVLYWMINNPAELSHSSSTNDLLFCTTLKFSIWLGFPKWYHNRWITLLGKKKRNQVYVQWAQIQHFLSPGKSRLSSFFL